MMIYLFYELYAAIIHLLAAGELGYFVQPHRIKEKRLSSGNVVGEQGGENGPIISA